MRHTFLVVDDNEIDQLVTRQLLKVKLGVTEINRANNGAEALEWLKGYNPEANSGLIILLDIKMPELDGFGFLEAFEKLDEKLKRITKIIMVSSTLDPVDTERAGQHKQVEKLLTKPLPINELADYLATL
ncbi:MAG TPA: response regulator [Cyclobacteriaceae bacterium]